MLEKYEALQEKCLRLEEENRTLKEKYAEAVKSMENNNIGLERPLILAKSIPGRRIMASKQAENIDFSLILNKKEEDNRKMIESIEKSIEMGRKTGGNNRNMAENVENSREIKGKRGENAENMGKSKEIKAKTTEINRNMGESVEKSKEIKGKTNEFDGNMLGNIEKSIEIKGKTAENNKNRPETLEKSIEITRKTTENGRNRAESLENSKEITGKAAENTLIKEKSVKTGENNRNIIETLENSKEIRGKTTENTRNQEKSREKQERSVEIKGNSKDRLQTTEVTTEISEKRLEFSKLSLKNTEKGSKHQEIVLKTMPDDEDNIRLRRSSTEAFDKLLDSLLLHQAKTPAIQYIMPPRHRNLNFSQNFSVNFRQKTPKRGINVRDRANIQRRLNIASEGMSDGSKRWSLQSSTPMPPKKQKADRYVYQHKLEVFPNAVQSLNSFKKACMRSESLLYADERLEISEARHLTLKDVRVFLKIVFFFRNKSQTQDLIKNSIEFSCKNGLIIWTYPPQMPEKIPKNRELRLEVLVYFNEIPHNLLFLSYTNQFISKTFACPVLFTHFLEKPSFSPNKHSESSLKSLKTDYFSLNPDVLRDFSELTASLPYLYPQTTHLYLSSLHIVNTEAHILLRLKRSIDDKLSLKATFQPNEQEVASFLLETLLFLLSKP